MRYLVGVALPVVLQILLVWILIAANTGNGSWVGLGAFLLGMLAIPATALINALYLYAGRDRPAGPLLLRCFGIAALMPVVILILAAVG